MTIPFDNSYARLPEAFYARMNPTPVAAPNLITVNRGLAAELGIDPDDLESAEGVEVLAGNRVPEGAEPIAQAYAGHQFGNFVPQLGDGRAILLGEVVDARGKRRDVQLKGAGTTPFSRRGDGRAPLGPVLREYVVSEFMHALGIPTTRGLAAVTTGETVRRPEPLPGGVFARVAASHIRVGTFQYFASRGDKDNLGKLVDYSISRHIPEAVDADRPVLALLSWVMKRQASLVARWMGVGFIHGVMNTDNTTISGETIDFGPCAFMDEFHPGTVYSSIDRNGRYAFAAQPRIIAWNISRLGEALLAVIDDDEKTAIELAQSTLEAFPSFFEDAYRSVMAAKLGLDEMTDNDSELVSDLLSLMTDQRADYTNTFRGLCDVAANGNDNDAFFSQFQAAEPARAWLQRWQRRLGDVSGERAEAMRLVNPWVIARNHRVEQAISAAVERSDFAPFHKLLGVLDDPYNEPILWSDYRDPPKPDERVTQTFCGT